VSYCIRMTFGGNNLRLGFVGAGRMGAIHIENAQNIRFLEVSAVCTVVEKEKDWTRKIAPEAKVFDNYDEFIGDLSIDAVVICSPNFLHEEHLIKALQNNKHVFCEKPLSPDAKTAWNMYNESLKYPQLKVACAFPRRFVQHYQSARKQIANGQIGKVIAVRSQTTDLYDPSPEFSKYIKTSGGIFVDCNIHDLDVALYLIGEDVTPKVAYGTGSSEVFPQFKEWGDVDNSHGFVTFDEGIVLNVYGSRDNPHGHHSMTEVVGTKGRVLINGEPRALNVDISDTTGTRMVSAPTQMELFAESYKVELIEFRDWVLFGSNEHSFNLKDAAKAVSMGEQLQQSLRSGQTVNISY
jgi:myo-inositol 2-dehydrogenase/D-chiro-inositol 1-dehydrogenase